jgi:hypothetical protein
MKRIRNRLKNINNDVVKALADEITSTVSSRRMFEAGRQLADRRIPLIIALKMMMV